MHVGNLGNAIDAGIGYLPSSRGESLFHAMSAADNITLASMDSITKFGVIQNKRKNEIAKKFIRQLNIKTPSLKQKVGFLSGGNQQKTALAKWICNECKILILNEPTKGIDGGAKEEV